VPEPWTTERPKILVIADDQDAGELLARLIDSQRKLQQMSAERELTQAELHRSETRLIEAQRLAQLGHWELDLGTYAMHWSHEVYRIFERDPAPGGMIRYGIPQYRLP